MSFRFALLATLACVALSACANSANDETSEMASANYDKPGYATYADDGRLWVFRSGSESQMEYEKMGEPAKSVTLIGEGPDGMTIRSDSRETINAYMLGKPGFSVFVDDGRLWVFRDGSAALAEYEQMGEPAKSVTLIGEGPNGMTVRSDSRETIDAYLSR